MKKIMKNNPEKISLQTEQTESPQQLYVKPGKIQEVPNPKSTKEDETQMPFSFKKILYHPFFALVIVIIAFIAAFASILPIKITQMGLGDYWVEQVIPLPYWIAAIVIVSTVFFMLPRLGDRRFRAVFVFASILLMVCIRMVFATIVTTVPAYEPDAAFYMNVISSWARTGVNFGVVGNYQHDYPLSFLIGFVFTKLGLSVNLFFRIAPLCIYSFEIVLMYLLVGEVIPEDKRYAAVSAFLFSISSLAYWVTVHYCPDLVGTLFFFVALYLSVRFAKKGEWTAKAMSPVLLSIFLLILSHHLSTLYFIVTMFGLTFSLWFFKTPKIKGRSLSFFILGVFTYTLWFVYGTLVYPSFFNVYVYLSGFGSVTAAAQAAPFLVNAEFAVYPILISLLSLLGFFELLKVRSLRDLVKLRSKLKEAKKEANMILVYSLGFVFIFILFLVGLPVAVIFAPRVLEVLFVGLYPVAGLALLKYVGDNPSKKKMAFILILLIFITIVVIHRYYNVEQRRVLFP
jgi:hypothetical protein